MDSKSWEVDHLRMTYLEIQLTGMFGFYSQLGLDDENLMCMFNN